MQSLKLQLLYLEQECLRQSAVEPLAADDPHPGEGGRRRRLQCRRRPRRRGRVIIDLWLGGVGGYAAVGQRGGATCNGQG